MKAYLRTRNFSIASILLLVVILSSCNARRYLREDQALVGKVNIKGIDKKFSEEALLYVQKEVRPNSRINLALYNTFNTHNGTYKTTKIRKIGEAPHILDSSLVEISRTQIEKFLQSKGFFKAAVKSDITVKNKKASIQFTAVPGPEFKFRKIDYVINDPAVDSLYRKGRESFTHIHSGQRYDSDSLNFEREQIFLMMKRNGYYDYVRQYVRFDVDSNLYSSQADLKLFMANPADKQSHPVYTISKGYITIKNSAGGTNTPFDSAIVDSAYQLKDYSQKFKPRLLNRFLFMHEGDIYDITKEGLTYDRLYDLNVFKNIKIDFAKTQDSTLRLIPHIDIVPLKKMSNRIEGEYTFNSGRNGFNLGDTYTNRNLFGGAELLEIKVKYGILFDATINESLLNRIFSRDFQAGVNYVIPKLVTPFRGFQFAKNGLPHTTVSSSFQLFDQKNAFSNRILINSLAYDWLETKYKGHSVTPINIEFRRGRLDPAFRDSLLDRGFLLYVRTNDRQYFNLSSQYAYTLNAIRLSTYGNFLYFRGSVDGGGNALGLIGKVIKFKEDADGFKTILGLPFQQYIKMESDLRLYHFFGGERQLVARLYPGIGIPYGNNRALTFEKNFFAGGSSGIRAWQARTLGPGNYNRATLASDQLRTNLRNLDQLGEIKLEGNLEYRFKIANNLFNAKVKGATFTDFGNIWRLRQTTENPGGEFKFSKFLGQMAIGTGAGLRFDLDYFVLRLDAGIKVKDPQFTGSDQWVIQYMFNKKDFKNRYENVTNHPDVYRFVNYNFGIGMPF